MTRGTPKILIVMGVSGSGKTTIASLLAERLGCEFADADWFHSPENVAKMAAGHELDDADRAPWLDAIADWLARKSEGEGCGVIACSALKRAYRDRLRRDAPGARIVYLKGSQALIMDRVTARHGHFMRARMLEGQFRTLEEPAADEHALVVSIKPPPHEIVDDILGALALEVAAERDIR